MDFDFKITGQVRDAETFEDMRETLTRVLAYMADNVEIVGGTGS